MQYLVNITDWTKTVATRGRGCGNAMTTRLSVFADNWNWIIATERQGSQTNEATFYGNFRILLGVVYKRAGDSGVKTVVNAILAKTKSQLVVDFSQSPENIGKLIDDTLNTSFLREYPPTVCKRIFGAVENDDSAQAA